MKPFAITLDADSSQNNKTGSWRTKRPVYVRRLPPCNNACPAGENIQEWLSYVQTGDIKRAWRQLVKNNPLPATMGRICYHPCESACNRVELDMPIGINSIERFLGDEALRHGWMFDKFAESTGKRVLIVGSGPAGLSAAYQLARMGHNVTIMESAPKAGGMMRYGIPSYRLPRDVLDAELNRILALGVELKLNAPVKDICEAAEPYDAAFVAVGAQLAKAAMFPANGKSRVLNALSVLRDVANGERPELGRRVAVYGGGNTAIDVARTAVRLGSKEVTVVYRRNRDKMPANASEVEEAMQEGVAIRFLTTIKQVDGKAITCEKMVIDSKGMPQSTGRLEKMDADSVILALGQDCDISLLDKVPDLQRQDGSVKVDEKLMTSYPGLFAGGDMVSSTRTATAAIGHGKKAARHINAFLGGAAVDSSKPEIATADRLNKWYYAEAPRTADRPMLDAETRQKSFDEVQSGLTAEQVSEEAQRCLSCGNCFECDNCYGVCPDSAIQKLDAGQGFAINYDYCKGCGLCASECPCGAIDMVAEEI